MRAGNEQAYQDAEAKLDRDAVKQKASNQKSEDKVAAFDYQMESDVARNDREQERKLDKTHKARLHAVDLDDQETLKLVDSIHEGM